MMKGTKRLFAAVLSLLLLSLLWPMSALAATDLAVTANVDIGLNSGYVEVNAESEASAIEIANAGSGASYVLLSVAGGDADKFRFYAEAEAGGVPDMELEIVLADTASAPLSIAAGETLTIYAVAVVGVEKADETYGDAILTIVECDAQGAAKAEGLSEDVGLSLQVGSAVGQALQLMLYGLVGVFAALTVLYLGIRLITAVFPYKEGKE